MKIVLVNLPWYSFGKIGVRAGSRWPHLRGRHEQGYLPFPFFMAYAAALLRKHGFDVVLIDAIAEGMTYGGFLTRLRTLAPDLLVCETSTVTLSHDLRLLQKMHKEIPVALCGPDANIRTPSFLDTHPFITYVLSGEYEYTLLDLAQHLHNKSGVSNIAGLIYRDGKRIIVGAPRPLAELDTFPWPLREDLPMYRYNDAPGNMPLPSVQMIASRGCPYRCSFCLWPQVMYRGNSYRVRDVADVVREVEYLVKEKGFKSVYFDDDTFNCGRVRMLEFCKQIKAAGLENIPWAIMARPDLMDEDILYSMKAAGLYAVKYGVESATQGLLDNINKGMDLKKTEKMIRLTESLGIKTHLTFTFGLPGETKESIRRTIDFAINLDPNSVQFSITTPFPGTVFYKEMKRKGHILSHEWSEYDGNYKSVICSEHVSKKDLESAIRHAYRRWAEHDMYRRLLKGQRVHLSRKRLFLYQIKRFGVAATVFKLSVLAALLVKTKLSQCYQLLKESLRAKSISGNTMTVGRLMLIFDSCAVRLFWGGTELTRGAGFVSSNHCRKDPDTALSNSYEFTGFQRVAENKVVIKKRCSESGIEETWGFEVIDEKQLQWSVEMAPVTAGSCRDGVEAGMLFSHKYLNWVDSWGEARFYPAFDKTESELRNLKTKVIGVRGRKRFSLELPTVLLDATSNNGVTAYARNALTPAGARSIGIRYREGNFSVRIKIVEENFSKTKKIA